MLSRHKWGLSHKYHKEFTLYLYFPRESLRSIVTSHCSVCWITCSPPPHLHSWRGVLGHVSSDDTWHRWVFWVSLLHHLRHSDSERKYLLWKTAFLQPVQFYTLLQFLPKFQKWRRTLKQTIVCFTPIGCKSNISPQLVSPAPHRPWRFFVFHWCTMGCGLRKMVFLESKHPLTTAWQAGSMHACTFHDLHDFFHQ